MTSGASKDVKRQDLTRSPLPETAGEGILAIPRMATVTGYHFFPSPSRNLLWSSPLSHNQEKAFCLEVRTTTSSSVLLGERQYIYTSTLSYSRETSMIATSCHKWKGLFPMQLRRLHSHFKKETATKGDMYEGCVLSPAFLVPISYLRHTITATLFSGGTTD